tara:strand:- start:4221 stop:5123 length:903 start_codon:yes stop_codon:yes gene_type:complete
MMRKKGYKRVLGLKKWNKIVSALVKDYKKRKETYDIKEVRKEASQIYKSFKSVPLSKISQKKVKKTKSTLGKLPKDLKTNTIRILATDIPKSEIDKVGGYRYFELEGILDFNNKFPEVPILIKTPDNELKINGLIGAYGGSELSNFVNIELREEYDEEYDTIFESSVALQEKNNLPYLLIIPENLSDKDLNKLLKKKVKFPKRVDKKVKKEVEKRILTEEEKKADKKRKKTELPKKDKKKDKKKRPVTPKVETRKPTPLADKNKAKELLLKEFELGLITKKQYLADRKKIDNLFSKGGKV